MNAENNLFEQYSYKSWAPVGLQQRYPKLEDALSQLETKPNLEAAFVAFWKFVPSKDPLDQFPLDGERVEQLLRQYHPEYASIVGQQKWQEVRAYADKQHREALQGLVNRLEGLLRRLEPSSVPDDAVLDTDALMFTHVSAALAVCLQRLDGTQTERLCEVVENAVRVCRRPTLDSLRAWDASHWTNQHILQISGWLVEALLWSNLFQKYHWEHSYQQALECLYNTVGPCFEVYNLIDGYMGHGFRGADWLLLDSGNSIELPDGRVIEPGECGPAIEAQDTGHHLVAFLVPAQQAVDAFDQLLTANQDDANWENIAVQCSMIQEIWAESAPNPMVSSG
jgi:hypothetical protein